MNKATIIKSDGTEQVLDHRPTLNEAQKIVGGYIEFVSGKINGKVVIMVVDEEGLLKHKPKNSKATLAYWARYPGISSIIVGDVIILEGWRTVG